MESNDHELKEFIITNCMCYYFNVITKIEDFDFDKILLDKKLYENILIYSSDESDREYSDYSDEKYCDEENSKKQISFE